MPAEGLCPPGYACPAGSSEPQRCASGAYCPPGTVSVAAPMCVSQAANRWSWLNSSVGLARGSTVASLILGNTNSTDVECSDTHLRFSPNSSITATQLVWADLTDDDADDLALLVNTVGQNYVAVAVNNGSFFFQESPRYDGRAVAAPYGGFRVMRPFDCNCDGATDVVILTDTKYFVYMNNASRLGTFTPSTVPLSHPLPTMSVLLLDVFAADFDNDGDVDMLAVSELRRVFLLVNDGNCGFTDVSAARGLATSNGLYAERFVKVGLGDFDVDGDLDLLGFSFNVSAISHTILLNNGSGFFTNTSLATRGVSTSFIVNAEVGDIDSDGDLDVVVGISQYLGPPPTVAFFLNNGSGHFASPSAHNTSESINSPFVTVPLLPGGGLAMVDLNNDGALDLPGIGFVNPLGATAGARSLYIVALGRNGHRNQLGAVLCVRYRLASNTSMSLALGCRAVDASTARTQNPYAVHFGTPVPGIAAAYEVEVTFISGRRHNASTSSAFGGISLTGNGPTSVVVRDVPSISRISASPQSGVFGPGVPVTMTITARWAERRLVPHPSLCCFVNDVNVSHTFINLQNGTYRVTYVPSVADSDVFLSAPRLLLALSDAMYPSSATDVADATSLAHQSWSSFSVEVHAPEVR
jgi:hypothetical protein